MNCTACSRSNLLSSVVRFDLSMTKAIDKVIARIPVVVKG